MDNMTGKKILISGMTIEIMSEEDDKWQCRNITTDEMISFKKTVIEKALKLGKAELVSEAGEN